jgi:glucosamine-phosphate N-acetyltransferase
VQALEFGGGRQLVKEQLTREHAFQIRRCRIGDFEGLLPLFRELWPDKPIAPNALRKVFNRMLTSKSGAYLCAVKQRRIVGFSSITIKSSLWQEGLIGHIDELVVHHECRGQGIGVTLLRYLEALAEDRGCRRVELDSASHRKEAHEFYKQRGFENRALLFSKVLLAQSRSETSQEIAP